MLNVLLIVLSAGINPQKPESVFWRAVDVMSYPAYFLAEHLSSPKHSFEQTFQVLMWSMLYYSAIIWAILEFFFWLKAPKNSGHRPIKASGPDHSKLLGL
jgi:hypothetical protein